MNTLTVVIAQDQFQTVNTLNFEGTMPQSDVMNFVINSALSWVNAQKVMVSSSKNRAKLNKPFDISLCLDRGNETFAVATSSKLSLQSKSIEKIISKLPILVNETVIPKVGINPLERLRMVNYANLLIFGGESLCETFYE